MMRLLGGGWRLCRALHGLGGRHKLREKRGFYWRSRS